MKGQNVQDDNNPIANLNYGEDGTIDLEADLDQLHQNPEGNANENVSIPKFIFKSINHFHAHLIFTSWLKLDYLKFVYFKF